MLFKLGWFISFWCLKLSYGSNHDGHCPNHWWKHQDALCIQFDDDNPDDFDGALKTCKAWTDTDAKIHNFLDIHEDWSSLITVSRLNQIISSSTKSLKPKIWINAIWFENQWYQILRVNIEHRLIRDYIAQGDAEVIPMTDLETLKFKKESYEDGDSLVYDPFHNEVFRRSKGEGKFNFLCTHEKEKKHKVDLTIKVCDQDDVPLKKASVFIDRKSTQFVTDKAGMVDLGEIEIGTPLVISVGSSADFVLGQKTVTVSKGMDVPIKINLQLEQRKVVFVVKDQGSSPLANVDIAVNGASIGTTGADGQLNKMYSVTDTLNHVASLSGYISGSGQTIVVDNDGNDILVNIALNQVAYTDNAGCANGDWGTMIVQIIATAATIDDCKEACTNEGSNCDFVAFEGSECGLGKYSDTATDDGTATVSVTTPTLSYKNHLLANAVKEFEENEQFTGLLTWHHRLFDKPIKVQSEEECAYQCLTSCGINQVCDYYSYIAQFCTLGNLAFQLGPEVFEIEKDCLPLTKIMYNKNKVADIKTKLAGTDRGTCPGAAANIELASGASVEVEPTATDGDCIFYVYNNNGGTVKLTLTETDFFSGFVQAELIVYAGGNKENGVKMCEFSATEKTCQWMDALAVVEYNKKATGTNDDARATIEHIP